MAARIGELAARTWGVVMLKVNARKLENVRVLSLAGRLVNGEVTTLREAVQSHFNCDSQPGAVVLDFAGVSAVDARGLGVLLELRSEAQARGLRLRVINASRLVTRVFEITHLDSVFEVGVALETYSSVSVTTPARVMPLRACA
jgi:anti-anti-sigma factor